MPDSTLTPAQAAAQRRAEARAQREANALRKNLLRRKAQSRARKNPAPQAGAKECR